MRRFSFYEGIFKIGFFFTLKNEFEIKLRVTDDGFFDELQLSSNKKS